MDDKKPREIIREELQKLSGLSWGKRLGYIWDYYKPLMAAVIVVIFLICMGVEIYHNLQEEHLMEAYFVNCNNVLADSDTMTADFTEYIGGLEKNQVINLDTSLSLSDELGQYSTASQTKITVLASANAMDVIVMDEETFDQYYSEGFFADLGELLSEEQLEKWSEFLVYREPMVDEESQAEETVESEAENSSAMPEDAKPKIVAAIDLTDAPALAKYNIYTDQKVYGGLFVQSEYRELFGEFFEFLLQ